MKTRVTEKGADKTCPQCGSVYEVLYRQIPVKDSDSADCNVCGQELDHDKQTGEQKPMMESESAYP